MDTVQDILIKFYPDYSNRYTPSCQQVKVVSQIMNCKTLALGGHVLKCDQCGHLKIFYNSCRNRHCPLCQGVNNAIWVDKRMQDVLDAPYFHLVFTMPSELHIPIYQNQKLLYGLMYKCVAETISELSSDPKYLGATPGFFSVLHTWGQDLHFHPHIHVVLLAGGLNELNQWQNSSKKFFIPVKVLAKKFRGKFLYYLKDYYKKDLIRFYGEAAKYYNARIFWKLVNKCYDKNWYTYTKKTFNGPIAVLRYLGRYTHKIAISNSRILDVDDNSVTIAVKDYKEQSKDKILNLPGVEFVRRFLLHVLPKGFVKIRYYGLLANRNKKAKLEICRKLINSFLYKSRFKGLTKLEIICILVGKDITTCPVCKVGKLKTSISFHAGAAP